MAQKKTTNKTILIDADVVSHFITAGEILFLSKIFPKNRICILDKVYAELECFVKKKTEVDNLVNLKVLEVIPFPEGNIEIKKEYFHIKKVMFKGDGESACLAVARYTQNIIASSNLKDIKSYCDRHSITYLTTMDFLCEALRTKVFDEKRCDDFISTVRSKGSILPVARMKDYTCRTIVFS